MFKTILAAMLFTAAIVPAAAAEKLTYLSGNDFTRYCKSKNFVDQERCFVYARGVADALEVWHIISPETSGMCIPENVVASQLSDVGVKYIADNPKERHRNAGALLAVAFVTAWPCPDAVEDPPKKPSS